MYWTEDERGEFAASLAVAPEVGVVIKDSGGVRVIYFVENEAEEIVLLTLYAKSATDNIKGTELKEIRRALEN